MDPLCPQVGKAKKNIMQKRYDEEAQEQLDWDNLAERVIGERETDGFPEGIATPPHVDIFLYCAA
jgi:hypothetical protein